MVKNKKERWKNSTDFNDLVNSKLFIFFMTLRNASVREICTRRTPLLLSSLTAYLHVMSPLGETNLVQCYYSVVATWLHGALLNSRVVMKPQHKYELATA
jgi:hypothetical protein